MDRGENLGKLQKPRKDWWITFPSLEFPNSKVEIRGREEWFSLEIHSLFGYTRIGLSRDQLANMAQTIKTMLEAEGYKSE